MGDIYDRNTSPISLNLASHYLQRLLFYLSPLNRPENLNVISFVRIPGQETWDILKDQASKRRCLVENL
jgi:hypothetical protein